NVMWTVDDEIRDELAALSTADMSRNEAWKERISAVLDRAEEMIYKETNILLPICIQNFTGEEWEGIYRDSKDYAECLGVKNEVWDCGEMKEAAPASTFSDEEIVLAGGSFTIKELEAILNTIPLEITWVDATDTNKYFNEGHKVFMRPEMAIGRKVYTCHPPKIEEMVKRIIGSFKEGTTDCVPVWMEKVGKPFYVRYFAVRDKQGNYLGTMELVQDMTFAKEHFCQEK
ncbi:MAG: PAS domain-containing protein, partial [Phoenicibacter congonensis]|nr:PAS domain-containing protein [Phoenicibacter congonensis]